MFRHKRLIKNATLYLILGFMPMGVNFFLLPLFSKKLSEAEYGILTLSTLFVGILTILIGLGIEGAFSRYYFQYYKKPKLVNTLLSTLVVTVCSVAFLIGILLYFFGNQLFTLLLSNPIFTYSDYGIYIFFTTISSVLYGLFMIYFRNEEKILAFSITSIAFFTFSITGILLGVLYFEQGALGSIIGRSVGTTIVSSLLLVYFIKKWRKIYFDIRFLKITLHYTLPLIPYMLILFLYNNIDKIMVEQSFGKDSLKYLGIYNLTFQISTAIQILLYAFFNSISPQIYKALQEKTSSGLNFSIKLSKVFHLIIMGVIVLTIAGAKLIFILFIDEKFHDGILYLGTLALIYIPQLYYVIFTIPLFFNKLTKTLPYISIIALIVGVFGNLILIPLYGIVGVCIATLATKTAQFLATLFYLKRYNQLNSGFHQMKKHHTLSLTILVVYSVAFLTWYIFDGQNFISIDVLNIIPLAIFAILSLTLFKNELKSIAGLFKKST